MSVTRLVLVAEPCSAGRGSFLRVLLGGSVAPRIAFAAPRHHVLVPQCGIVTPYRKSRRRCGSTPPRPGAWGNFLALACRSAMAVTVASLFWAEE